MTDEELMSHYCATGDQKAFAELFSRFENVVRCFLMRATRDESSVDDLVQQVFISLWRYRAKYREGCSVKTFVIKIASSHIRMAYRHSRVQRRYGGIIAPIDNSDGINENQIVNPEDPSLGPLSRRSQELLDLVSALPEKDRTAIECVFFQGMTWAQAAEHLGMMRKAFDSHLCRLLRRLRESLTKLEAA